LHPGCHFHCLNETNFSTLKRFLFFCAPLLRKHFFVVPPRLSFPQTPPPLPCRTSFSPSLPARDCSISPPQGFSPLPFHREPALTGLSRLFLFPSKGIFFLVFFFNLFKPRSTKTPPEDTLKLGRPALSPLFLPCPKPTAFSHSIWNALLVNFSPFFHLKDPCWLNFKRQFSGEL